MPVQLTVGHKSDQSLKGEAEYHQDVITIGRDRSNIVHLSDPSKTVSRYHAQIQQKENSFIIMDCESRNATYVNSEKVEPGTTKTLSEGDLIQIGDFRLTFKILAVEAESESDFTVALENPFKEDVEAFRELFTRIQGTYAEQPAEIRAQMLSDALDNEFSNTPTGDVGNAMADRLASVSGHSQPVVVPSQLSEPQQSRMGGIMDILISSILELMTIVHDFRRDMVNITVIKTEDTIYGMTHEKLKSYLLDERLSDSAASRRGQNLREQVNEIILHHKAMQSGYKAAIKEGPSRILEVIDPENIERRIRVEKFGFIPSGWVPFLNKIRTYRAMKQIVRDIQSEGQVANDRHLLRPLFIETYMERMSGQNSNTSDSQPF